MAAEKAEYPVTLMSRILKESRSGFYAWHKRAQSARARSDRALVVETSRRRIEPLVTPMAALGCTVSWWRRGTRWVVIASRV
jgi:hypothetical protein